jgi:hypothetical protein
MPERRIERARFCARCGSPVVVADAIYCKECGTELPHTVRLDGAMAWNPTTALILSVVPGLGHWYKRSPGRGTLWFLVVMLFYSGAWPLGFVMHLICAANAALNGAQQHLADARYTATNSSHRTASAMPPR